MAKIFYSLAGEGRGHAARVRALVERLKHRHEIVIFTSDDAYDFLAPLYSASSSVQVERIPGLRFHYSRGEIDLVKTAWAGLDYRWHLADLVASLRRRMLAESVDLAITDFEPALPRAAQELGVPVLSIDHQHFLVAYELSSLPFDLRCYANMMAIAVNAYGIEPDRTVVSAFYRPPLKAGYSDVIQAGPLLRPEVALATPHDGDYLLSYLRPATPPHVLQAIRAAGIETRIYGLGPRPDEGCLKFRPIDQRRFVADLAGCRAVIAAAGNQLLGEALYFGKPVLALPEARHHEQLINAHFLRHMARGDFMPLTDLSADRLRDFLDRMDQYRGTPCDTQLDGTPKALSVIEQMLSPLPLPCPAPTAA